MCARCVVDVVHASDPTLFLVRCPAKGCADSLWDGCKQAKEIKAVCEANGAEVQDYPDFDFAHCSLREKVAR